MKLFFSPTSPYVRKVMVAARELGLVERIEKLPAAAHPVNRSAAIREHNPLGQVPTLFTDDGQVLYDSRVICEYLDALGGGRLFGIGNDRWRALTLQAMGDGLMGAALLTRYEQVARPEALRWEAWATGQLGKVVDSLDRIETIADSLGERADIGTITLGCALGYLDFRFPGLEWRKGRPRAEAWFAVFGERPSMQATLPAD